MTDERNSDGVEAFDDLMRSLERAGMGGDVSVDGLDRGDEVTVKQSDGTIARGVVETVRNSIVGVLVDGESMYIDVSEDGHGLIGVEGGKRGRDDEDEAEPIEDEPAAIVPPSISEDSVEEVTVRGSVDERTRPVIQLGGRGNGGVHEVDRVDESALPEGVQASATTKRRGLEVVVYKGDAVDRDRVVGDDEITVLGRVVLYHVGDRVHLWHLWVREEARGRGFGSYLMDVFEEYVRGADAVHRVSGRVKRAAGVEEAFFQYRGLPASSIEVVEAGRGDVAYEAVAFGAGDADPGVDPEVAVEEFDGIAARRFLVGADENIPWPT